MKPKQHHWRCPDCGVWCNCTGVAQSLAHLRCGVLTPKSQKQIDDGMRRAYESWLRAHKPPGGYSADS